MNNWKEIRKTAIVEADDFQDHWDRNGLNFLFYWKTKYPKFKITLYTIPNRTSKELLEMLQFDWIEFAVHGWDHESNFECFGWDYDRTQAFMRRVVNTKYRDTYGLYQKNFKAPGWTITPGGENDLGGCGYPADPKQLISKDPQAVYKALTDMGFVICDRHYNVKARPENAKIICIDCNPDIVHFHTWDMPTGDPNSRNGFKQIEEEKGVPWDQNTEFYFMSEAWEKGLFKACEGGE